MPSQPPLVLLDVDGVLNAVGPAGGSWPDWQWGHARAGGRTWPVRWSPSVVEAVRGWQQVADVQWLTTWGHDANAGLHELLGVSPLPVAGTYDQAPEAPGRAGDPDADLDRAPGQGVPDGPAALAAVTPAAPDALTGHWWKFDVVRALVRAAPERRLVWLDDDLASRDEVRAWTRAHADCLLIAPDPRSGLVAPHLQAVDRFLGRAGEQER